MIQRTLLFILFVTCLAFAQEKNELGLMLGVEFIPNPVAASGSPLSLGRSITYSANYARRLSSGNTAFFLEVPFAATPSHKVSGTQPNLITNLATLYAVPSVRVRFRDHPLSPWISGGFGYGLYRKQALAEWTA